MSTSSASKRQTTNSTSNIQTTDQSYRDYSQKDSNNTYLDGGVIASAFNFSTDTVNKALSSVDSSIIASLDYSTDTINQSLSYAQQSTDRALDFASNISKQISAPEGDITKYALIGLMVITAIVVFKK